MSRTFWLLVNICLAAVAVVITEWVTTLEPGSGAETATQMTRTGKYGSTRNQDRYVSEEGTVIDSGVSLSELDELWEHTLFRPERTEDVPKAEGEEKEEEPEPTVDMELIGIGIIADKKAAIILVKPRAAGRRPSRGRSHAPTPRGAAGKTRNASPAQQEKKQRVYKVGQQIEDTGYEVKEIEIDQVLLVRGDEERILKLEAGDEQSQSRRDSAAAAEKVQKVAGAPAADADKKEEKSDVSKPPAPPPPPPVAGGVGVPGGTTGKTPTTTLSREERIKRAREIRERLLQQRRQAQDKN